MHKGIESSGLTAWQGITYSDFLTKFYEGDFTLAVKIENLSSLRLSVRMEHYLNKALDTLPREHLRGIEKLRLVDAISDPRIKSSAQRLPGLYHPRQGVHAAWLEIAVGVLLPTAQPFYKKLLPRLSLKGNLVAILFSLVGQHYYLTLRHSIKRTQIEPAVRSYTEKQLKIWSSQQQGVRARLFRPFQPTLEKWSRSLQKRATEHKKRNGS